MRLATGLFPAGIGGFGAGGDTERFGTSRSGITHPLTQVGFRDRGKIRRLLKGVARGIAVVGFRDGGGLARRMAVIGFRDRGRVTRRMALFGWRDGGGVVRGMAVVGWRDGEGVGRVACRQREKEAMEGGVVFDAGEDAQEFKTAAGAQKKRASIAGCGFTGEVFGAVGHSLPGVRQGVKHIRHGRSQVRGCRNERGFRGGVELQGRRV